jgi:fibronectin-binding autotransporter adhesin
MYGLTITKGLATYGGGVYNAGALSLTGCVVSNNTAAIGGGGIYNAGGSVTLTNCTISGNAASGTQSAPGLSGNGGGIYTNGGSLIVSNTDVSNNTAVENGGGIYGSAVANILSVKITDLSNIFSNKAGWNGLTAAQSLGGGSGGGIYLLGGLSGNGSKCVISVGSTVKTNTAYRGALAGSGWGGGIGVAGGASLTIWNATVASNVAQYAGGGLSIQAGARVTLTQFATLGSNTAGVKNTAPTDSNNVAYDENSSTFNSGALVLTGVWAY